MHFENTCNTLRHEPGAHGWERGTMSRKRAGRPASSRRLKREDCAVLPVATLPNLPALPRPDPMAVIPVAGNIGGGLEFSFMLRVVRMRRTWLCFCPQCSRRAAVLYFAPGSAEPGCRGCLRLVYESQYEYTPEWARYVSAVARWYTPEIL